MIRVALRGIRAHFVRFGMAVLAVALGVAFVAGTYSLRAVLASTFNDIVDSSYSAQTYVRGADMVVGLDGTTGSAGSIHAPVPATLADELRDVDGVDRAYADYGGMLVLVGKDGTAVTTTGAPTLGVSLARDDTVVRVTDGDYAVGPEQIVLEESTAERAGLTTGDRTKIILDGDILDVTVSGLAHFDATMAGALLVGLDPEVAAAAYAPEGTVPTVSVFAEPGVTEAQLRDAVASHLAAHPEIDGAAAAEVLTGNTMREEQRDAIGSMLGFIQVFLLVFAGVSLFVGGFLIANTFSMSVRERMREFALLRAIGASPAQVFASILGQALVIGVLGSAVGIGLGIGIAAGLSALMAQAGMEMGGAVELTADTVVVSLVVGTIVSLIAAAIPARRAALTAPVEAMRAEAPTEKGLRVRTIIGAVLTFAGIGGVAYASFAKTADGLVVDGAPMMLGIGAVTLVVGMLVLAPVLARWVVPILAAPFAAWAKPLGGLAKGNVVRNPRRTASTAGALMIGMVLVSASGVLAASTTESIGSVVKSDLKSDLIVQTQDSLPEQAADAMAAAPSVGAMDVADYGMTFASGISTPQFVFSADPELYKRSIALTVVEGEISSYERGEALALKPAAKSNGWKVGDTVTLGADQGITSGAAGTQVRIGAIVDSRAFGGAMFVPRDVFDQVVRPELAGIAVAFATAADGFTIEQLRADLVEIAKPYFVISVMDSDEMVSSLSDQVNQMLTVIYALLALSVLIAVLGIVNTLALSIIERTREVALLRAVGLGRLQLSSMVAIESVLTALFGTILGVAVGVGIATALPAVFADEGMSQLVVPWGTLGGMVVLAAIVGLIAAVWPSIRAARMPVLDGLAAE